MFMTVISEPGNRERRDHSVRVTGVMDVPQECKQNICKNICYRVSELSLS
jgi:hypothetical protein